MMPTTDQQGKYHQQKKQQQKVSPDPGKVLEDKHSYRSPGTGAWHYGETNFVAR